jgi:hypothetical protein
VDSLIRITFIYLAVSIAMEMSLERKRHPRTSSTHITLKEKTTLKISKSTKKRRNLRLCPINIIVLLLDMIEWNENTIGISSTAVRLQIKSEVIFRKASCTIWKP